VLLPLVENAVKYGMRTSPVPLRIAVTARLRDGRLILSVENSGHWLEPRPDRTDSTQIGLTNLRRRLALLHGDDAHLTIQHNDRHVRVTVDVPAGDPLAATAPSEQSNPA
jgi:LytS/YehU family sensor histidine kinase